VLVKTSANYGDLPLPAYKSQAAAGLDLLACIDEDIELLPGKRALVPTGIYLEMPEDCSNGFRPFRAGRACACAGAFRNGAG
jgi:dUTP pyrophosphatase